MKKQKKKFPYWIIFVVIFLIWVLWPTTYVEDDFSTPEEDLTIQPQEQEDFTDLIFYDSDTNCNLSGILVWGNFTATVVEGKYRLYKKDYRSVDTMDVILYGDTDVCFGKNSNLPFYLEWESDYILEYSEYTFEAIFNPRSPEHPQAMQGFIRPYEVQERLNEVNFNEDNSQLENISQIFGRTYMNYISDSARFGKADYWQTPSDFIKSKGGDCEDWAIYTVSLLRAYDPNLNCYAALWYSHMNVLCQIDNKFIILDQDKVRKNLVLDEDLILQDNQIKARSWRNDYFKEYGIEPDERILYYLFNEKEFIEFENGQEDFIEWVLERGEIIE